MEGYKLTKEERESIKNIFKVAKRAKMRVRTSINEHDLLGIMREEKSKIESKKDINIRLTLESDLKYCNQITPALETIAYGPTTDGTKEAYFAEKLIPYVKKYKDMIVKAIKLDKEDEEYVQQLRKWEKTGKPEDFPYIKGRTRSEELKQQDKESSEQMKKYNEAKDKTCLELPMAEGLTYPKKDKRTLESKVNQKTHSPNKWNYIPLTEADFMAYVDQGLAYQGVDPSLFKKDCVKCLNNETIKLFEYARPKRIIYN